LWEHEKECDKRFEGKELRKMQDNLKNEHVDFCDIKRNLEKNTKTFAGELCLPSKCTQQEYNAITQEIEDRKYQKRKRDILAKFQ